MTSRQPDRVSKLPMLLLAIGLVAIGLLVINLNQRGKQVNPSAIQPNESLTPQDVVKLQLDSLADNPASGTKLAYAFSTPRHQAAVGSPGQMESLMETPDYQPLLRASSIEYFDTELHEDWAQQIVAVTDAAGTVNYFLFELRKQKQGEQAECWLTDSIVSSNFYLKNIQNDVSAQ